MGLWIKNDDGSIEKVAGSGGGGGSFDGEHVLTGDVDNPPEDLAVGQLMWDGVEGGSGGSGAGPHDHAEYALLEHDHDAFTHDHDYLPLEGGHLDGPLSITREADDGYAAGVDDVDLFLYRTLLFGSARANITAQEKFKLRLRDTRHGTLPSPLDIIVAEFHGDVADPRPHVYVHGNLEVDGRIQAYTGVTPDNPAIKFDAGTGMYRKGTHQIGFAINGVLVASIDSGGVHGRMAFGIADGIDTQDVLERAETATMPIVDEGVATTDVESLTVNEVVSALLAKVKEQSEQIAALTADVQDLRGT